MLKCNFIGSKPILKGKKSNSKPYVSLITLIKRDPKIKGNL